MMKRLVFPLMLVAVTAAPIAAAAEGTAATAPPVAVACWAGYDAWLADVELLGKVSDNPDLAKGIEAMLKLVTGSRGLAGLDKTRPVGAILLPDGQRVIGYGYVPVTSLAELISVLKKFRPDIAEESQGVWRIPTHDKTLFATERDGWAVVADRAERLAEAPAAPAALLAELAGQYDLALRVLVKDVPVAAREKFKVELRKNTQRDLQRRPGESDLDYSVRKRVTERLAEAVVAVAADLEDVTVGWSLDAASEKMLLDVSATAKPGTPTARQMARLGDATTQFAGFKLPEAALTGNWAGKLSAAESAELVELVDAVQTKAVEEIERKAQPAEKKENEKHLATGLLDVVREMLRGDRVDGAFTVVAGPPMTVLGAQYVGNGTKLEHLVRFVAEAAEKDHPKVGQWIQFDAGQCEGVRLHTIKIPIEPDAKNRAKVVQLVGETLDVVVGVGKENVYLAAGKDAMETLQRAITASKENLDCAVPPVTWSVALGAVADFVSQVGEPKDRPMAVALAAILKSASGDEDHITLTVGTIPQGVRVRVEAEAGLLKALGATAARGAGG
ncbi:MAG: hypothetical protein JW809_14360 [Pirellulales bacterium]|nr:hypothetical protein [Pirellulales bacterium]